jgi:glycosyltransferase involved in cell wall biosynthesis
MKILMIAPQPFFTPRGTPISVYQRLRGISKLGHQVDLLTYPIGNDVEIPGVKIYRTIPIPGINNVRVGPSWSKLLLDIFLFFKCVQMLVIRHYDIIHSHEEGAFLGLVLSVIFRTPHLYDMHSSLPNQLENFSFGNCKPIIKIFEIFEIWVLKSCKVVITTGKDLEEYVLQKFLKANHIRIENIPIIEAQPNVEVFLDEIKSRFDLDTRFTIVYTGTLELYQGLGLLLNSAKFVIKKRPDTCFIIVGGRPDQVNYWKQEAERLGVKNNIIFIGQVSLEDSLNFLELAEILVSPRIEGLTVPLKIYSYLHTGKPSVVTNIYSHTQVLNEEIALIVDPNPSDFAEGILKLIENPKLRYQLGCKAKEFAQKVYSIEDYLVKLKKAYLSIKHSIAINELIFDKEIGREEYLIENIEINELA